MSGTYANLTNDEISWEDSCETPHYFDRAILFAEIIAMVSKQVWFFYKYWRSNGCPCKCCRRERWDSNGENDFVDLAALNNERMPSKLLWDEKSRTQRSKFSLSRLGSGGSLLAINQLEGIHTKVTPGTVKLANEASTVSRTGSGAKHDD